MSRLIWHGEKVARRIAGDTPAITRKIAEVIARAARRIVVVKSGKLKRNIRATDTGVEAATDYAAEVELGTATRAARPYMRPAIEQFSQSDLKQCVN